MVDENQRSIALTITRTGTLTDAVSVRVVTQGGDAVPGVQFVPVDQTIMFAAGETGKPSSFRFSMTESSTVKDRERGPTRPRKRHLARDSYFGAAADPEHRSAPFAHHYGWRAGCNLGARQGESSAGLLVTFSGPVDAAEAQGLGVLPRDDGGQEGIVHGQKCQGRQSEISRVQRGERYRHDHAQEPLKLTTPVQFRVSGLSPSGLKDNSGWLIDGNHDGQPGGDAIAVLRKGGATISAMVFQGSGPLPSFKPSLVDVLLEHEDLVLNKNSVSAAR